MIALTTPVYLSLPTYLLKITLEAHKIGVGTSRSGLDVKVLSVLGGRLVQGLVQIPVSGIPDEMMSLEGEDCRPSSSLQVASPGRGLN